MDKLIHEIRSLLQKLPGYRQQSLNETTTRRFIIDPLLESLDWDILNLDEVQLEYSTIDGKFVDYALKLNGKPVLLVEAKPLQDSLKDNKAIGQIISYATNAGVEWCILTNGIKWQVYKSMEKRPAPDKLLFEVNLDSAGSEGEEIRKVAKQLWSVSREEMTKGTLDYLGEITFTDDKVRKALLSLMIDPPGGFLKSIRNEINDTALSPKKIKESLVRIANENENTTSNINSLNISRKSSSPKRTYQTDKTQNDKPQKIHSSKNASLYDEAYHLDGKPEKIVSLFRSVERYCLSFEDFDISRKYVKHWVNYLTGKKIFCSVVLLQSGLRLYLPMKYSSIENPPEFSRDVTRIGHYGVGDLELRIDDSSVLEDAKELIYQSLKTVTS